MAIIIEAKTLAFFTFSLSATVLGLMLCGYTEEVIFGGLIIIIFLVSFSFCAFCLLKLIIPFVVYTVVGGYLIWIFSMVLVQSSERK